MRLKNYTDLPTAWVKDVIRAVRPPGIGGFDVRVSNGQDGARGRAYTQGSSYHDRACPFVVVSIAREDARVRTAFQTHAKGKGYLPGIRLGTRREALVFVLAHELRHLWQGKVARGRRVWGARGQFSERDADAYALQMLRRFRRGELLNQQEETT